MFVRCTRYRMSPEYDSADGQAEFERGMRADLWPVDGLISTSHLPGEDGWWHVVALWHSESQAMAALPRIQGEFAKRAHMLAAGPVIEFQGDKLPCDYWPGRSSANA